MMAPSVLIFSVVALAVKKSIFAAVGDAQTSMTVAKASQFNLRMVGTFGLGWLSLTGQASEATLRSGARSRSVTICRSHSLKGSPYVDPGYFVAAIRRGRTDLLSAALARRAAPRRPRK